MSVRASFAFREEIMGESGNRVGYGNLLMNHYAMSVSA